MEFHFLRPYWFFAVVPIILMIYLLSRYSKNNHAWHQVIDANLLNHLLIQKNSVHHYRFLTIVSFVWLVSVFALAGPTWKRSTQPLFRNQAAKVILLDLSPSMLATDIPPNRLERAKYKVLDILKKYPEGQTAMIAFSSEAYTVTPLTNDTHTIALMVPELSQTIMPVAGSNIGNALEKAENLLKQGNAKIGTLLVITDNNPTENDLTIAKKIHADGYTISVLGVGTTQYTPMPLDINPLEKLADAGGGRFSSFTNTDQDIRYLLKPSLQTISLDKAKLESSINFWIDEGRWFILLILPFILFAFRRGDFWERGK